MSVGVNGKEVSMSIYWKRLVVGLTFTLIICVFAFVIGYTEEKGGIEGWNDPRSPYPDIEAVKSRLEAVLTVLYLAGVMECWSYLIID